MQPDYSSEMLQAFLHIRVDFTNRTSFSPGYDTIKAERHVLAKTAGVTKDQIWRAWQGKPVNAAVRTRLWAALGVYPADFGVVLTDDGGQMSIGGGA
jgi:hypothetical protein